MNKHRVTPERIEGVLVKWEPSRGFGFVRHGGAQNVFISAGAIRSSGIDETDLVIGMRLVFEVRPDPDGRTPRAFNIEIER